MRKQWVKQQKKIHRKLQYKDLNGISIYIGNLRVWSKIMIRTK